MTDPIGILGCGWLGLPLAKTLLSEGYSVKGTTTSPDKFEILKLEGINPYLITMTEDQIHGNIAGFLDGLQTLLINIPPGLRGKGPNESYIKKMELLLDPILVSSVKQLIFVSSTSVYGNNQGEITDSTIPIPATATGEQLLACEDLFHRAADVSTTVVRFAGLIGPNRHPVTQLSQKKNLTDGEAPVNLIHLNDCIGILQLLIRLQIWGETFIAVYPDHPKKSEYYTQIALKRGIPPPTYVKNKAHPNYKLINCSSFLLENYDFTTPLV